MPNIKPISEAADQKDQARAEAARHFLDEMNRGMQAGEEKGWLTAEQVRESLKSRISGE